jgi:uncharacterized damage-inducible protein DinB
MNTEILLITQKFKDAYEGDPWFGRNAKALLAEVDESIAFQKPSGQHSIVQLLWHMIVWREFTISRLSSENERPASYFEQRDWMQLDHSDKTLWKKGLDRLQEVQMELIEILQKQSDDILSTKVKERTYDFRKLLHGISEHDIYHLGQIAYVTKLLRS